MQKSHRRSQKVAEGLQKNQRKIIESHIPIAEDSQPKGPDVSQKVTEETEVIQSRATEM